MQPTCPVRTIRGINQKRARSDENVASFDLPWHYQLLSGSSANHVRSNQCWYSSMEVDMARDKETQILLRSSAIITTDLSA